jgi:hypothetical protein
MSTLGFAARSDPRQSAMLPPATPRTWRNNVPQTLSAKRLKVVIVLDVAGRNGL